MLKNNKVVLFVTLKTWSGRKLLNPTTYIGLYMYICTHTIDDSVLKAEISNIQVFSIF